MKKLFLALPLILLVAGCKWQNSPVKLGDVYTADLRFIDNGCTFLVSFADSPQIPPFRVVLPLPNCQETFKREVLENQSLETTK